MVLVGCSQQRTQFPEKPDLTAPTGSVTSDTGTGTGLTTPTTGTTVTWSTTFDCTAPLPTGPFNRHTHSIHTEEDFTFDGSERLVFQDWTNIVGADPAGNVVVLATGAPGDPAGMEMRNDVELFIAGPDTGTFRLMNLAGGGELVLLSGLDFPNGVEADTSGIGYISEFSGDRVMWFDPATGNGGNVATGFSEPNGLALSPDETQMYITSYDTIFRATQVTPGTWADGSDVEMFYQESGTEFLAVEVDVCGNVYLLGYSDGKLRRIDSSGNYIDIIGDETGGLWSALNFGNGSGSWARESIFLSDRGEVVGFDIGIPGAPGPNVSGPPATTGTTTGTGTTPTTTP
jgi:sugar lactone lactonase YvrE